MVNDLNKTLNLSINFEIVLHCLCIISTCIMPQIMNLFEGGTKND